jgi:hypothetical protein
VRFAPPFTRALSMLAVLPILACGLACGAATGLLAGGDVVIEPVDAGHDAGGDAEGDTGAETGIDASRDTGSDTTDAGESTCVFRAPGGPGISEVTCPAGSACVPTLGCIAASQVPPQEATSACGSIECACECAALSICNCSGG